jgi:UDP-glucose 4-epimerase
MESQVQRLLIVGAAGYIGRHLVHLLQQQQAAIYEAMLFCHHRPFPEALLPKGWAVVYGELNDTKILRQLFDVSQRFSAVILLTGQVGVALSFEQPDKFYAVNVEQTRHFVEYAVTVGGVRRIIYCSSASVYGDAVGQLPLNPYGCSKLMGELVLRDRFLRSAGNVSVTVLRLFNVVGNSCSSEIRSRALLLDTLIDCCARNEDLQVFGGHSTADSTAIRDFVHVVDVARAVLNVLRAMADGEFQVFEVGSGTGTSVLQVAHYIRDKFSACYRKTATPAIRFLPKRIGDPAVLIADISGLLKQGWTPTKKIHDIIDEMLAEHHHETSKKSTSTLPSHERKQST